MKLHFFRHPIAPNFGDELNPWLWPQLLGDILDEDDRAIFIGIGSVLSNDYPARSLKVVMGAGFGGYKPPPVIDETWSFGFVRGPQTAEILGLPSRCAVTDGAVLVRSVFKGGTIKQHRVSYIPHWESLYFGHWQRACDWAGVNLIDPRNPVDAVLREIAKSDLVITEAMHGAIIADALRVPWVPVLPIAAEHRFKWTDWTRSLQLEYKPRKLPPSSYNELWAALNQRVSKSEFRASMFGVSDANLEHSRTPRAKVWTKNAVSTIMAGAAAATLWRLSRAEPMLSRDGVIAAATDRALECVDVFRRKFKSVAA